jgi:hypothetical protein
VTEPGGVEVLLKNGRSWQPAPADVRRLGVTIETSPTDNFATVSLGEMSAAPVDGGTVYSRIRCEGLSCLFEVGFVPPTQAAVAVQCGVYPAYLRVVGVSDRGLAAARRSILFRWGAGKSALSLAKLGPTT